MDLSKPFDTINHDLIIAKLEAYGFSISFLRYVHSYLNQLLQRTGVNSSFILWKDIIASVLLYIYYCYIYIYMTLYLIQRILKATKQFQIIILQLYKNEFIKITCTCLLLHKSKVSERKMFNQINKYIAPFLFNVLTGFPTLSIKNAGKMETSFYFIVFLFKLS